MRNNKQQTRVKASSAVAAVDRKIAKAERGLAKVDRYCDAYDRLQLELRQLYQKRSVLFKGVRNA
ncbi:hypothetical protein SCYZ1_4 [Pseudomonas phage SCYZ1]|nr:hypothetical protein SCYZ1_4 [Pseudomonas phage SCYZ1]